MITKFSLRKMFVVGVVFMLTTNAPGQTGNGLWQAIGIDTVFTNRIVKANRALIVFQKLIAKDIFASGNVGIGTLNPSEKLEVVGNVKVQGKISADSIDVPGTIKIVDTVISLTGTVSVEGKITVDSVRITGPLTVGVDSFFTFQGDFNPIIIPTAGPIQDQIRSTNGAITLGRGNATSNPSYSNVLVGIGTQTPTETLEVNGTAKITSLACKNCLVVTDENGKLYAQENYITQMETRIKTLETKLNELTEMLAQVEQSEIPITVGIK